MILMKLYCSEALVVIFMRYT